jgi:anti-anti-sigma factor
MTLTEEQGGDISIACLSGHVDSVRASELETKVMGMVDRGVTDLLLDCSELSYINSAGLRVFLLAAKQLSQDGGTLAFCSLTPHVRLIFETIGFDRILTLYADREEALEHMRPKASRMA